jgi:hypothetical protein
VNSNSQNPLLIRIFLYSAGVSLFVTAIAKIISFNGSSGVLKLKDPVFGVSFNILLLIVGLLELLVALTCFLNSSVKLRALAVACLASNLLVYRIGLSWMNYKRPCHCLGNLTDALHIPPQTAETAMKIILLYLLLGSYNTLFWLWWQNKKPGRRMQNDEVKPAENSEMGVGG